MGAAPLGQAALASLAASLASCCPPERVRPAGDADAVDGVQPALVVRPATTDEVSRVMAASAAAGAAVVPRGRGTKLGWGTPPSAADVIVDLSGMDAVVEHAAGDLVVRVQPGATLAGLAARLAPAGQRLALDEVVPGSTVGGVLATGLSGPGRSAHGAVRDLVLGVTVVMADGTVARSGGKVVKNVAGYDLAKLYTGSYGTLGVIVEAALRLHPLPAACGWVEATYPDTYAAARPVAAVLASQAVPSGVEVERPAPGAPVSVAVAVEGSVDGVAERSEAVIRLLGGDARLVARGACPFAWWGRLPGEVVVKITAELAAVPQVMAALSGAARASAGAGVVHAALPEGADLPDFLARARVLATRAGGSATLLRAPAALKAGVDVWGPVPAIDLMRRVKQVFDPAGRMAPGRFVGGL